MVVVEWLKLANMARSAKGTVERPGKGVKAKSGLNRSLQDAALGRLVLWICVKAEEAERRVWKINPVDTSRQCAPCGYTDSANRHKARFCCKRCGHVEHADVNAAQNIAARGATAEALWAEAGRPLNRRPKPRLRRRKADKQDQLCHKTCTKGPGRLLTRIATAQPERASYSAEDPSLVPL